MVVEKTDGTEEAFRITDDYPILQYQYGGEDGVNTLEIQTADGWTAVPCPEIKRLYTREAKAVPGDVDGDGVIGLADAVLVINHYVGKPVTKFNEKAADVDGDGVIDLADAVRIINFYVGKVQSLAPSLELDGLDPQ
jgi:hypothetical protein